MLAAIMRSSFIIHAVMDAPLVADSVLHTAPPDAPVRRLRCSALAVRCRKIETLCGSSRHSSVLEWHQAFCVSASVPPVCTETNSVELDALHLSKSSAAGTDNGGFL